MNIYVTQYKTYLLNKNQQYVTHKVKLHKLGYNIDHEWIITR